MPLAVKEGPPYIPDYEPKGHLYSRPCDGLPLDSVTTIIRREIGTYRKGSYVWAQLGTEAHLACQWHDEGNLKDKKVDKFVTPYAKQYVMALEKEKIKVLANEIKRYDTLYLFAGRIDKYVKVAGRFGLMDLKTGDEERWHRWQTAGYERLAAASHDHDGPIARFCLYLCATAYYLKEHTEKHDLQEFMALNAAYKVKANAGYYRRGDGN